jgi:rubrerythrin
MMTVKQALAYSDDLRDRWVRLGVDLATGIWTYMCPKCSAWFHLVTRPTMPDECPKCGAQVRPAPEGLKS